jgi:hypothetical protein
MSADAFAADQSDGIFTVTADCWLQSQTDQECVFHLSGSGDPVIVRADPRTPACQDLLAAVHRRHRVSVELTRKDGQVFISRFVSSSLF